MKEPGQTSVVYNGVFTHGVDVKRRVQIPAKWRPKKPRAQFTLVLWPKYAVGKCLRVLPEERMEKLMAEIEQLPNTDPNKTVLMRIIGTRSVQVNLDKGGRICLPEDMAREADIKDKAVLAGLLTQFEIWNPERYAEIALMDSRVAADAFKILP
ncbi:MAG: hypothetical protein NZ739_01765 [Verrucomicrobiae bacterium]|nr:hypothetical protein [Verrucomicrobiae bacterium]MCX7722739.1 hypothetical protein [Verrucomicrobiae bacterium]MDW7981140.1 hypothetical protein [Verrucomicrobiales bacterium]